jgi:hypothetical protein
VVLLAAGHLVLAGNSATMRWLTLLLPEVAGGVDGVVAEGGVLAGVAGSASPPPPPQAPSSHAQHKARGQPRKALNAPKKEGEML